MPNQIAASADEACPENRRMNRRTESPHRFVVRYARVTERPYSSCLYCRTAETAADEETYHNGLEALRALRRQQANRS